MSRRIQSIAIDAVPLGKAAPGEAASDHRIPRKLGSNWPGKADGAIRPIAKRPDVGARRRYSAPRYRVGAASERYELPKRRAETPAGHALLRCDDPAPMFVVG